MPLTDYMLDPVTHDVVIKGGDYVLTSGRTEVAQAIRIYLLTLKGEWFLDPTIGWIDFQNDFRFTPNLRKMRQQVFSTIASVPGVLGVQITLFELDREAGNLRIEYTAQVDGNATVEDGVSL